MFPFISYKINTQVIVGVGFGLTQPFGYITGMPSV